MSTTYQLEVYGEDSQGEFTRYIDGYVRSIKKAENDMSAFMNGHRAEVKNYDNRGRIAKTRHYVFLGGKWQRLKRLPDCLKNHPGTNCGHELSTFDWRAAK